VQALRHWSRARVALVSIGWVVLCALLAIAWLTFQYRAVMASSGSGGVGAVVVNLNLITLGVPLVPPLALIAMWIASRLR
jgi:hypothetical protein